MLYVRCFDDFDNGYPQILIDGDAEDYLHAANYLSGRKFSLEHKPPNGGSLKQFIC